MFNHLIISILKLSGGKIVNKFKNIHEL